MPSRWSNWPLRIQLAVLCALILLLVNLALGLALRSAVRAFLIEQTAMQLQQQVAGLLAADLALPPPFRQGGFPPGQRPRATAPQQPERLSRALAEAGLPAQIYAPDGRVVATVGDALPRLTPAQIATALRAPLSFATPGSDGALLVVALPWQSDGLPQGVIQVASSLAHVDALLQGISVRLWIGVLCAALLAAFGCWAAGALVLRPLQRLLHVSRQVTQGDLSMRSGLVGANEVGHLGQAFDRMLDQLAASLALQQRFVADAAHELRTPLTALSSALELLLLGAITEPEAQRRALQRSYALLERLSRLVGQLLLLSRLDARLPLPRAPVDLCALAQEVIAELEPLLAEHDLRFEGPARAEVMGHADQLRQVIFNLLDNARRYTPAGGRIVVRVVPEHQSTRLIVSDTGIGIAAEALPRVWERFWRVDQQRTAGSGGSGLGLAIVKSSVEAHGGSVAITSRPGQGTTVECVLPQLPPNGRPATA
ncbi:sensor histidine kinase [Kallotenue papyrolyticum]|uniref:sensor histidine kinase n=1 Tax=Kallotenue papyrolyticum TaxID=1325125 RepID=UPI00046E99BA|nr:ATP-binding protein [Kallotenue papyrolyticum]